jgi:hypothetical protein
MAQPIAITSDARQARCWKAPEPGDWPRREIADVEPPAFQRGDALVNVTRLGKSFGRRHRGLLDWRLSFAGGRPRLRRRNP